MSASDWRQSILLNFPVEGPSLTMVADPDSLLVEPGIRGEMERRGYQVLPFDDPVMFRLRFERDCQPFLEERQPPRLVVRLGAGQRPPGELPCDLCRRGRSLNLSLAGLFPRLSYPVLQEHGLVGLDRLFQAEASRSGPALGPEATLQFLVRQVYGLESRELRHPGGLLARLLRRHYHGEVFPPVVDRYLLRELQGESALRGWPLGRLLSDRSAFFAFLQECWPAFLARQVAAQGLLACEGSPSSEAWQGEVPFDHPEVRVYVDTLFLEGLLKPVPCPVLQPVGARSSWVRVGILEDPGLESRVRWERLLEAASDGMPGAEARPGDWLEQARRLGELRALEATLTALPGSGSPSAPGAALDLLWKQAEATFGDWLLGRYGGLVSLPAVNAPWMLHHVPRFMARRAGAGREGRLALLVVDGLSLEQWFLLRDSGGVVPQGARVEEGAVFAWIPTLTSVSRQALFAGEIPLDLAGSLGSTSREPAWWKRFWGRHGMEDSAVGYLREVDRMPHPTLADMLARPELRVLGLVVPTVDRLIHGAPGGRNLVRGGLLAWAAEGLLHDLLALLLKFGFEVFLTSDHGNIEAEGIGTMREGSLVDQAGHRARIYRDAGLRERALRESPSALVWPGPGLPRDFQALLAPPGCSFTSKGQRSITHGGASLEEVIVPFIRFFPEDTH